ncbi:von Willebrand factor type A [Haloterrigena turkmenica DSM 5511]|uniref:von Willebrand factor type A n=1 Tax=Haloterrigena turkmenica (strain ATCC 51198 / DSM 5511 / JCM 9101 / NCIMB 13204 / VKM B-1734 / 4k) TaxID=543526 RepID=D2RQJ2_HALTV|nr:von Willebrand factor type A [Haloterrigena turkmenica DSM 5511]
MVFLGATTVYVVGMGAFDAAESQAYGEQSQRELRQFDSTISSLGVQDDTPAPVQFNNLDGELISDGQIEVTVSDGYVNDSRSIELETLVATDKGGNEFAYQAGGAWDVSGDRATAVSDPNLRYYYESTEDGQAGRVDIVPVTLTGTVGTGEHTVREIPNPDTDSFESLGEDIEVVSYTTVEVSGSSYHHGWYNFLKDEFDATDANNCEVSNSVDENIICHDESEETVTVVANVDGEEPLRELVDIEPTVRSGLYIDGETGTLKSSLSMNAYGNHSSDGDDSPGFLLANYDEFHLHNHADIEGVPVVNGELGSKGNPSISPIGYGVAVNGTPQGESESGKKLYRLDSENEGEGKGVEGTALATELSQPYTDVDPIDDKIDRLLTSYLSGKPSADGDVSTGMYSGEDGIDSTDSSDGNVNIGVDGSLDLSDVEITGNNRTNFYVDGNVELSDVEIQPDDRADSLWVYATSDSTITIEDDFQGVVYAPGADLEIKDDVTIDGAVIAGDAAEGGDDTLEIGDDVQINFDRSLRSATPLSEEDTDLLFEYSDTRPPVDVTFVLDRSGSMGPHNPTSWSAYEPDYEIDIGEEWEPIPTDEPFRNTHDWKSIQVRDDDGTIRTLEHRDFVHPDDWTEIRVHPYHQFGYIPGSIGIYPHPGNDPTNQRVEATRNVIDELDPSADRVGVYDFASSGRALHPLSDDLESAKESVVGTAYGGTNMAAGLEAALNDYATRGTDDRERIVILLSDGKNSNTANDERMDELADRSDDLDYTLHTVGLDALEHDSIPEDKLEGWATETGGNYYQTADPDELLDLFEEIVDEEIDLDMDTQMQLAVNYDTGSTANYAVHVSERTVEIDH